MHGTLKAIPTHPLAEHVAQKIPVCITHAMKLPCIEVLRLSKKPLERRNTRNISTKVLSCPQEMMYCCLTLTSLQIRDRMYRK